MSITEAIIGLPTRLGTLLRGLYDNYPDAVDEMFGRPEMSAQTALMAGLSIDPNARTEFENALQIYAAPEQGLPNQVSEVIVGGGAHAAVYAAVRKRLGYPAPLVLDQNERFGGTIAMTRNPAFYLNSRNRPGPLGSPGTRDALNVIPGAPMQPADIGGSEYQTNADLGLVIRCTLALNATVREAKALSLRLVDGRPVVTTSRGAVMADRVIVATGLGRERTVNDVQPDGARIWSYRQFMERMDCAPFPLRNLGRVAVIGGGDSARTVVEALTGIGPSTGMSVASLDYVERIEWYGAGATTKSEWENCNRNRYKRLGSLFPSESNNNARVTGREKCETLTRFYGIVTVNSRVYDTVIVCVGYARRSWSDVFEDGISGDIFMDWFLTEGSSGVRIGQLSRDRTVIVVGPAADIPWDGNENRTIEQNRVGLFRLAPRTATAAMLLDGDPLAIA